MRRATPSWAIPKLPELKVRRVRRYVTDYGYAEPTERIFQQLGYDTGFGFKVIDEEEFPMDIAISLGAFGDMGRPWTSKFVNWIPKAQGGTAEDFA